jgi:hypothetical protein
MGIHNARWEIDVLLTSGDLLPRSQTAGRHRPLRGRPDAGFLGRLRRDRADPTDRSRAADRVATAVEFVLRWRAHLSASSRLSHVAGRPRARAQPQRAARSHPVGTRTRRTVIAGKSDDCFPAQGAPPRPAAPRGRRTFRLQERACRPSFPSDESEQRFEYQPGSSVSREATGAFARNGCALLWAIAPKMPHSLGVQLSL